MEVALIYGESLRSLRVGEEKSLIVPLSPFSPLTSIPYPAIQRVQLATTDRYIDMGPEILLWRWKRFLLVFASIDIAIEATDPVISHEEFRGARCKILEILYDASVTRWRRSSASSSTR
ncbi:hypothetical protein ABZP36_011560 [Zizania latifolia]